MSHNRYEHALFTYIETHPEELKHWRAKIVAAAQRSTPSGEVARALERELWEYFVERSGQVPALRELHPDGLNRISLLNLTEHLFRLWGPPPKTKPKPRF